MSERRAYRITAGRGAAFNRSRESEGRDKGCPRVVALSIRPEYTTLWKQDNFAPVPSGWGFSFVRPLVQHPRPCRIVCPIRGRCLIACSNTERALPKTVAGIEQAIDLRSVSRPLLDLVEIADVRNERVVDFVV